MSAPSRDSASDGSVEVEVVNRLGLHARAAAKIVRLASSFSAQVELEHHGQRVDAKSIMGVLLLCAPQGARLRLFVEGAGAGEARDALVALFSGGFGEAR